MTLTMSPSGDLQPGSYTALACLYAPVVCELHRKASCCTLRFQTSRFVLYMLGYAQVKTRPNIIQGCVVLTKPRLLGIEGIHRSQYWISIQPRCVADEPTFLHDLRAISLGRASVSSKARHSGKSSPYDSSHPSFFFEWHGYGGKSGSALTVAHRIRDA